MNSPADDLTWRQVQRLVRWAAQECRWQMVTPIEVASMIEAYFFLYPLQQLTPEVIMRLGHLVQPDVNSPTSWRKVNVIVGSHKPPDWQEVPRLMEQLIVHMNDLTSTEFFREFEEIHPFQDGNGRVGSLLYNWLDDTYEPSEVQFPPNLFHDARRMGVRLDG